jgi:hypothetical protein
LFSNHVLTHWHTRSLTYSPTHSPTRTCLLSGVLAHPLTYPPPMHTRTRTVTQRAHRLSSRSLESAHGGRDPGHQQRWSAPSRRSLEQMYVCFFFALARIHQYTCPRSRPPTHAPTQPCTHPHPPIHLPTQPPTPTHAYSDAHEQPCAPSYSSHPHPQHPPTHPPTHNSLDCDGATRVRVLLGTQLRIRLWATG